MTALYRKYRPKGFDEVVRQEAVVRTLQNAVEHGQVRQAYLFAGPRGTGKTSMARILAKALNCARTPGFVAVARQDLPRLPCDRKRHVVGRGRDGCRLATRHRRHSGDPRARRTPARGGPIQDLHPRRSAPAHGRRVAGAPQAHRGASSPPPLRLLHDRAAEGARDRAVALPDVRLPTPAPPRGRHLHGEDQGRRRWSQGPRREPARADLSWSFTTAAAANQPPAAIIDAPSSTLTWKVGDLISFSGHATDPEQGTLPASALTWTLLIQHCPSTCHAHTVQTWTGTASGSFNAPDHDYPSYLELRLTATDAGGLATTTSVNLNPITVVLSFASTPSGLQLSVGGSSSATPFTHTVIVGSTNAISATTPQQLDGTTYQFSSWSDGGAQTHNIVAPARATTNTATYTSSPSPPVNTTLPSISGSARVGRTLTASDGTWSGSLPMTFAYQWLRCSNNGLGSCTTISGATAKTYVPTSADVDNRLRVRVTATNAAGSASATSNATGRIKA